MNSSPEAIQAELLDKFYLELCQWNKQSLQVEYEDLITPEKKLNSFVSVNQYIEYNHNLLINEIKQTIAKRGAHVLSNKNKKAEKYVLKDCD